jgi:hypothetical protein
MDSGNPFPTGFKTKSISEPTKAKNPAGEARFFVFAASVFTASHTRSHQPPKYTTKPTQVQILAAYVNNA